MSIEIDNDEISHLYATRSIEVLLNRYTTVFHEERKCKPRRIINKIGQNNIGFLNISERSRRYAKDFVNTFVEERWRYVIGVFVSNYFITWTFFALLWYLIAYSHGDLTFDEITGERLSEGSKPCVEGATNLLEFFIHSMEMQTTMGGEMYPTENCPEGVFLVICQIMAGIIIEGVLISLVYTKLVRPPKKSSYMKFSRNAVICQRDLKLCLLFRISDSNESHVVQSKVSAFWLQEKISNEGEMLLNFQHQLKLTNNGNVFLVFPQVMCHIIDESSPLYNLSAVDILSKRFEIVVCLSGSSRETGQLSEDRTSYLPKEILWGHRFKEIVKYDNEEGAYVADYNRFDETEVIDTPLCSAMELNNGLQQSSETQPESPNISSIFITLKPIETVHSLQFEHSKSIDKNLPF